MNMNRLSMMAAMLAGLVAVSSAAQAITYAESGDASNVFGSQQNVGGGVDTITGSITDGDEGDLFEVTFGTGGSITIEVTVGSDTELFLFDATGAGIAANDDKGGGSLLSEITENLVAGTYIIGIGDYQEVAVDTDGDTWTNFSPPPASFGILDRIENTTNINSTYAYSISLSQATASQVPEPTTLLLMGLGLAGIGIHRRRTYRSG